MTTEHQTQCRGEALVYIQVETQRLNELALIVSALFASLTMLLGFLAFPSFFADLEAAGKFAKNMVGYAYLPVIGEILLLSLPILGLGTFLYMVYRWVTLRRRRTSLLP